MRKIVFVLALLAVSLIIRPEIMRGQENEEKEPILIGSSMDLSGKIQHLSKEYLAGAQSFIKYLNEQGGINQRSVELVVEDDGYQAQRCAQNTMKLITKDKVLALFSYVGTATTAFSLPIIQANKMSVLGVLSGAQIFQKDPNIFNVRASYYKEIDGFVKYCIKDLNLTKVAVFYQYDAYGMDGLKSAELALFNHSGYKIEPVATAMYKKGDENIIEAFTTIKNSGAEAVILVGVSGPVVDFANMCAEHKYNPLLYTLSVAGIDFLKDKLTPEAGKVIISQVVPPFEENSVLVQEYKELLSKYSPGDTPTLIGLEGFINARVLAQALRGCDGVFTKENFLKALENIKDFDVGNGSLISYGSQDHEGMDKVYYSEVSKDSVKFLNDLK